MKNVTSDEKCRVCPSEICNSGPEPNDLCLLGILTLTSGTVLHLRRCWGGGAEGSVLETRVRWSNRRNDASG